MKLRASRRFHYIDEYTDEEGRRIHYNDESKVYFSLDATEVASSRPSNRWVHLIPVMVILCFVILWRLSSHPVVLVLESKAKVVVKDGRNESVLHTEIPRQPENDFRTNHAPPEYATSPVTSKSSGFKDNNKDEPSTDPTWTLRSPTDSKPTGDGSPAPDIKFLEFLVVQYD